MTDEYLPTFKPWAQINEELDQTIPQEMICPADQRKGIYGDYIKGSTAIVFANKVFGNSGWDSFIEDLQVIELPYGMGMLFYSRVKVVAHGMISEVPDGDESSYIERIRSPQHTDVGCGAAIASWNKDEKRYEPLKTPAIETAMKGAVTDAKKRALRNFGRYLGSQLYFEEDEQALLWGPDEAEHRAGESSSGQVEQRRVEGFPIPVRDEDENVLVIDKWFPADKRVGDSVSGAAVTAIRKLVVNLPEFAGKGPRWQRHIQKWFAPAENVEDLTFEELAVLLHYGSTGNRPDEWYKVTVKVEDAKDEKAIDAVSEMAEYLLANSVPEGTITAVVNEFFPDGMSAGDAQLVTRVLMKYGEKKNGDFDKAITKSGKVSAELSSLFEFAQELMSGTSEKEMPF